ncbi:putative alpha-amylase [Aureobasidium pullulans]|uniref:alpha-amylase n=1 Tax=Aureobasidium pullulans TaxID=5580 RepID=A0A4S8Z567_AURPU|nr:putative alpha-amylase [Aureobasidium pullulans]THW44534.1 putative alpha-amylase [Aureobasidium pullulans]THW62592.1 putative alpha-amylase [Aureobasidium pullulans]TIA03286.1 putative alpha-amylase [Aureobasidium pullulans]
MHFRTLTLFLVIFAAANGLSPSEWRPQSIYQVMTDRFARTDGSTTASCDLGDYCGGTWKGLVNKLDYIQNMGFTAVWISPVVKNLDALTADGSSYHGYWAQDIYQVNTNFGSAADLVSLSDALHKRGMYLMVDIVTNHMGYAGCGDCVDYSTFNPFDKKSYYHPFCLIDYNNHTSMELCWEGDNTVSLPDLRTEDTTVQDMWATWIKQLVANYTIDGLRIDSTAEVDKASLKAFESAAGIYAIGEVFNNNADYVCGYQGSISGLMNYPLYYNITSAFSSTSGDIKQLENGINTMKSTCADTSLIGSFIENHDNPRFPSLTADMALAKNAIAFQMLADGIPVIYQGQEQHFSGSSTPKNREALWTSGYNTAATLYKHIAKLNAIRKLAIEKDEGYLMYNAYPVWTDEHTIVMRKGGNVTQIIGIFNNLGSSGNANLTLLATSSGFDAEMEVVDLLACEKFTTDGKGDLDVGIKGGVPVVLYSVLQIEGSGLCES